MKTKTLRDQFRDLDRLRTRKLNRARECAELSIPSLFPPSGSSLDNDLIVPFSATAANGAASLAARWTSAIIGDGDTPFFAFDIQAAIDDAPQGSDEAIQQLKLKVADLERSVHGKIASSNFRSILGAVALQIIVVGDVLLCETDDVSFQAYRLDQYVVKRDHKGQVYEIILKELVDAESDPILKGHASDKKKSSHPNGVFEELYTRIYRHYEGTGGSRRVSMKVETEFRDTPLPAEYQGEFEISPYWALGWSAILNEPYHRSLIEENIGLIRQGEALAEALAEQIAAAAEYRMGVKPGGIARIADMNNTVNGEYVAANEGDIFTIKPELLSQIQVISAAIADNDRKQGAVFLRDSSIQPTGDRVTAFQSSVYARELLQGLHGSLATTGREVLVPIVLRTLEIMRKNREIPDDVMGLFKNGLIQIRIRTGLESLHKEVQSSKLKANLGLIAQMPETAQREIKWEGIVRQLFILDGLEHQAILKSETEKNAERNAAIQDQAAQQMIQSAGAIAEQALGNLTPNG